MQANVIVLKPGPLVSNAEVGASNVVLIRFNGRSSTILAAS